MTELINLITSKPNWESKIDDKKIIKKWTAELSALGVSGKVMDLVLELLRDYESRAQQYSDMDATYPWPLSIKVSNKEYSIAADCDCLCNVCQECEYKDRSDYDGSSENEETPHIECICTKEKLVAAKQAFVDRYIVSNPNHMNSGENKKSPVNKLLLEDFKNNIEKLRDSIEIDYHPGSNDQVVDLIHPSMYCYVKGVTRVKKFNVDNKILFQWLPAEFSVGADGRVNINSYINNLSLVDHLGLYIDIAKIFEYMVPQFNEVLRRLYHYKKIDNLMSLEKCQVIVKLADTILTPDSPNSPPSSWHLEGLPHEKIIATGIYYYEITNITQSFLEFRTTLDGQCDIDYPQDGYKYVETHYGFTGDIKDDSFDNTGSVIELGSIKTTEGMCLVFPNFLQHRVSKFTLANNKKPGCRKILVFFLVDPSSKILSTANVKPQQTIISPHDAKLYRELLMYQRKYEISDQNSFFERGWSLCEH